MKKIILAGVCLALLIIGIVIVVGILNLGPVIKTAVNTYGPEIVKTGVGVEDVDVSVLSAQAQLKNFVLGNPDGFVTARAMQVKSIFLNVDESSFLKDTVVIDRIEVDNPEITYEIKGRTDNFRTIIEKMEATGSSAGTTDKAKAADKNAKNLLIRDFIVKGGRVNMAVSLLKGKVVTAALPDIHLQNIGRGEKGAPPEEVFRQIFEAVYGKMTSPELSREFASQLKELGLAFDGRDVRKQIQETRDQLEDVRTEIKGMGEQLKGLLHK